MKIFILVLLTINLFAIDKFEFFEDKTNSLEFKDILKIEDKFQIRNSNKINFRLTKSTIWIKFNFENSDFTSKNKILKVFPAILEHIDLYEIDEGVKVYKNGSAINIQR